MTISGHSATIRIELTSAVRKGEGYVREEAFGRLIEFGPMPRDAVGPFIDERKEYWRSMIAAQMEAARHKG